jgi:hypothetical protein
MGGEKPDQEDIEEKERRTKAVTTQGVERKERKTNPIIAQGEKKKIKLKS